MNGYHFCNRMSPKQNFVSLHHTIIFLKGPDKMQCGSADLPAALGLVESCPQIVAVISAVAVSQRVA